MAQQAVIRVAVVLLIVWFMTAASAEEGDVGRFDVFPLGMGGVARYRIPGMVVTTQGTILAYCEARRNGSKDWG